jgi:hypothetical protein
MFFKESSTTPQESSGDLVADAIQYAQDELLAAKSRGGDISTKVDFKSIQLTPEGKDSSRQLSTEEKHSHTMHMKHSQTLPIHEWACRFPNLQLSNHQDIPQFEERNTDKKAKTETNQRIDKNEQQTELRKILKEKIMKELLEIHQGKQTKKE